MDQKTFSLVAGGLFSIIAVLHALRLVMGWHAAIGGFEVPMWLSVAALIVSGFLGWSGLKLASR